MLKADNSNSGVVVTICIGTEAKRDYAEVLKLQRNYAKRWGLEYFVIDEAHFRVRPNVWRKRRVGIHFEKFQVLWLLSKFPRVIYLDADVVPTVKAPDLLQHVGFGSWGCVAEPSGPNDGKFSAELERLELRLGKAVQLRKHRYFNAGVLIFDRTHKDVWRWCPEEVISGRWPEQSLLNYRVARGDVSVTYLDAAFNLTPLSRRWEDEKQRLGAAFVHYAGPQAKAQMATDVTRLAAEWEALGNG
jgi:hypothetical protein